MASDPFRDVLGAKRGSGHVSFSDPGPRGEAEFEYLLGLCHARRTSDPLTALVISNTEAPLSEEGEQRRVWLAGALARVFAAEAALSAANRAEALVLTLGMPGLSGHEKQISISADPFSLLASRPLRPSPRNEFELRAAMSLASTFAARGLGALREASGWGNSDLKLEDPYQVWLKFLATLDPRILATPDSLRQRLKELAVTCSDAPRAYTRKLLLHTTIDTHPVARTPEQLGVYDFSCRLRATSKLGGSHGSV